MTEFEYHDLLNGTTSVISEITAVFISVFIAYLVCMYLVGKKLTKFQITAVSFTYSMFALLMVFLVYRNLTRISRITASYLELETAQSTQIALLGPAIMLLSWLISIIFMIQIRRSPN